MTDEPDSVQAAMKALEEARRKEWEAELALYNQLARKLNLPGSEAVHTAQSDEQPKAREPEPEPEPAVAQPPQPPNASFDGTFAGLIDCYRANEKSSYHQLKYKVRLNYDGSLKRITTEIGNEQVADWTPERIQRAYDGWVGAGKISIGHLMIGKLRMLTSFGSVVLNDDACTRLSTILGNMRFPLSKGRKVALSTSDARSIRATAHEHFNWPSIALAQAIMFELPMLRQVDVIGEWVPIGEPGTSEITKGNEKWLHGLRWSDIDENMILRRTLTSGRRNEQKQLEVNLKRKAWIMEEINRVQSWRRNGPMVICEYSNVPWTTAEFRRKWRIVADKAGVPKTVRNMDSSRSKAGEDEESRADTAL